MKIYVVTSGCYSDFHINAMFSTREKAQMLTENAKKLLRPILLELRGRRDWAMYELREVELC